jgi:tyrosinase
MMRCLSFISLSFPFHLFSAFASNLCAPHVVEDLQVKHVRRQASTPYAVTGVQMGQILPRLEIRNLETNFPDQFNVYLLGLQRLQQVNQTDMLSHFKLAGIHGVPVSPWNGVGGIPGSVNPGFCTHNSNIFLPWHRPYLALYEQVVVGQALAAANQFPAGPMRDRYLAAAATLRLPYWDWAIAPKPGQNSLPDSISQPTITVTYPNGTRTISNPLYSYSFHPVDPGLTYIPVGFHLSLLSFQYTNSNISL